MRELGHYCFKSATVDLNWHEIQALIHLAWKNMTKYLSTHFFLKMKMKIFFRTVLKNKWKSSLIYTYLLGSDHTLSHVMVNLTKTFAFLGSWTCQLLDRTYTIGPPGPQAFGLSLALNHWTFWVSSLLTHSANLGTYLFA